MVILTLFALETHQLKMYTYKTFVNLCSAQIQKKSTLHKFTSKLSSCIQLNSCLNMKHLESWSNNYNIPKNYLDYITSR